MLLDSNGRRVRRSIGFLPEYRVERDAPADAVELVALIASAEPETDEDIELDKTAPDIISNRGRFCLAASSALRRLKGLEVRGGRDG